MTEQTTATCVTASRLQEIAARLSNNGWCRYWMHWNDPVPDPWVMRIEVKAWVTGEKGLSLQSVQVQGLTELGFEWDSIDGCYYIDRDIVADGLRA